MNVVLWIFQVTLALLFIMAGLIKALQYIKAKEAMAWVSDVPKGLVIFVGYAELLGAIGLILPMALGTLEFLTPVAGFAFAFIMLFAAIFHVNRKEYETIPMIFILLFISLFIGIGRLFF
ncbi:hypothetical protein MTP04_20750 [Lysinibacillus sp. PLM2]|nr:hypothetical protein MTP04_20750 [Lysinibacillus sp. PLM2]